MDNDYVRNIRQTGEISGGRSDATLNAGGVRIGTAEIYAAIEDIPEVADAISFGQDWTGDTRIVHIVTLADGHELDADLRKRIKTAIRTRCSPRHVPKSSTRLVLCPAHAPESSLRKQFVMQSMVAQYRGAKHSLTPEASMR